MQLKVKAMKRNGVAFLCLISLLAFCPPGLTMPTEQQPKKCAIPKKLGGKYKLVSIGHSVEGPLTLGLRVVVKPENFSREYMLQFAQRVKLEYCNEQRITVVIFDDYLAAKSARIVVDYLVGRDAAPELRGFYSLDRTTGEEGIQFSTVRGKPADEIVIDLSSKTSQ